MRQEIILKNYLKVSASWELGFSDFNIILLKNDEKNIENGEIIAEEAKIEKLQDYLRAFGGKEYVDENTKAYRQVIGKVVPLGIGLTESPAADVEGVSTKKTVKNKMSFLLSKSPSSDPPHPEDSPAFGILPEYLPST